MIRVGLVLWLQVLIASLAFGHEVRPAYLEIRETEPAQYQILWKTPARGDATIRLEVRLPETCTDLSPKSVVNDGAAQAVRWQVKCAGGLAGETVAIDGLDTTLVETIVRFERADGATQSARLKAGAFLTAVSIGILTSLFIEISQSWMPSRSSTLLDLILNSAGTVAGAATYMIYARYRHRSKAKR